MPRLGLCDRLHVVYMIPEWGAPLKALSGYLPPLETQDFVVYNYADTPVGTVTSTGSVTIEATEETSTSTSSVTGVSTYGQKYDLKMPLGLTGYFTLEEGLAAAKAQGANPSSSTSPATAASTAARWNSAWEHPRVRIFSGMNMSLWLYVDDKTTSR